MLVTEIWRLHTGNFYRSLRRTFSIAKSTATQIYEKFWICQTFNMFSVSSRGTREAIEHFETDMNGKMPQALEHAAGFPGIYHDIR